MSFTCIDPNFQISNPVQSDPILNYTHNSNPSNQITHLDQRKYPLTLSSATSATSIPPHGHSLHLVGDILEESEGTLQLHAIDGLGGLAGVLEADTQVRAAGAGALRGRNFLSSVTDLSSQ